MELAMESQRTTIAGSVKDPENKYNQLVNTCMLFYMEDLKLSKSVRHMTEPYLFFLMNNWQYLLFCKEVKLISTYMYAITIEPSK